MPTTSQESTAVRVGLFCEGGPIPLQGVVVEADLSALIGRVTITQRYRNDEPQPIEALYVFPLDDRAAVTGFEAIVNGVHFVGEVYPRDEAFALYDDAIVAGHGGYLLEMEAADVFRASIGNVPPGGEVLIRLSYVAELTLEGRALRFTLPLTVSPRYAPAADRSGIGEPRALTLNPPVQWSVPYGLDFTLRASMPGRIRRVESPSHPVAVTSDDRQATVTLAARTTALDRDVVVLIDADGVHEPTVRVERDEAGSLAAAVSVTPAFEAGDAPAEVVFLVDRSGSMDGSSIAEVRNALQLCLRSLTKGCRFNIVGFGNTYVTLFPESRPYSETTLAEASAHVAALRASMGGTELLPALEYVLAHARTPGLPRRVVLLTDGDVTNVEMVMAAVAGQQDTRVFTFGIGNGPSAALIRGVARVGRGEAEFIRPGERIEAKVMRQFGRLLADGLDDVQVEWGQLRTDSLAGGASGVFAGSRLVRYALLGDVADTQVTIRARHGNRTEQWVVPIDPRMVVPGCDLGRLAAYTRIRELEDVPATLRSRGSRQVDPVADSRRAEVERLAMRYGLLSRETSFVAVERRIDSLPGEMALRRIPVALRAGWGGVMGVGSPMFLGRRGAPEPTASLDMHSYSGVGEAGGPSLSVRRALGEIAGVFRDANPRAGRRWWPSARPATRALDSVVALQAADGRWPELSALLMAVSLPQGVVDDARRWLTDGYDQQVFATTLALVWLARQAQAEQAEWARLATKAEAWLMTHATEEQRLTMRRAAEQLISEK